MTPDDPNAQALGSFRFPVALTTIDPDEPPLIGVCFNETYLPYIVGALKQLLLQATWDTNDPDALNVQQGRIFNLIGQFAEECPMFAPGLLVGWASSASPPDGWLVCDGSAVNRTTYAALFDAIGALYGVGDGSTTFNVPDMRSRSPLGAGTGSGLSNRPLASTGGEENHQLITTEMPAHVHGGIPTFINTAAGLEVALASEQVPFVFTDTGSTGGNGSHNTMHPYLAINWLIKT